MAALIPCKEYVMKFSVKACWHQDFLVITFSIPSVNVDWCMRILMGYLRLWMLPGSWFVRWSELPPGSSNGQFLPLIPPALDDLAIGSALAADDYPDLRQKLGVCVCLSSKSRVASPPVM
jgi:hypothetical protein